MHGFGFFTWADGKKYTGQYSEDKKHGSGTLEWADGRKYDGQWLDGKQNGRGFYTTADGVRKEAEWKDGKKVRWIKTKDSSGKLKNSVTLEQGEIPTKEAE